MSNTQTLICSKLSALLSVAALSATAAFSASHAAAAESQTIHLDVHNVTPGKGQLLVGLCRQSEFLTGKCSATVVQQAISNPQRVKLSGAPAGLYAVQVVYDKNDNFKMDTGSFGAPTEPVGFSRDAVGRMGPPAFTDASFQYDGKDLLLRIRVY